MVDAGEGRTTITVASELLARVEAAYEAHFNAVVAEHEEPAGDAGWWRRLAAADRERAAAYDALAVEVALCAPLMRACHAASRACGDKADHHDDVAAGIDGGSTGQCGEIAGRGGDR